MLVASLRPRYPRTGYLLGHQGVERSSLSGHLATEQPPSSEFLLMSNLLLGLKRASRICGVQAGPETAELDHIQRGQGAIQNPLLNAAP